MVDLAIQARPLGLLASLAALQLWALRAHPVKALFLRNETKKLPSCALVPHERR